MSLWKIMLLLLIGVALCKMLLILLKQVKYSLMSEYDKLFNLTNNYVINVCKSIRKTEYDCDDVDKKVVFVYSIILGALYQNMISIERINKDAVIDLFEKNILKHKDNDDDEGADN